MSISKCFLVVWTPPGNSSTIHHCPIPTPLCPGALAQGIALSISCCPLGCHFETRCGRVLKGHTVCGMAGQECGFAHVAGLVEWHHTCVRIYLRSFAGKHTHTHAQLASVNDTVLCNAQGLTYIRVFFILQCTVNVLQYTRHVQYCKT